MSSLKSRRAWMHASALLGAVGIVGGGAGVAAAAPAGAAPTQPGTQVSEVYVTARKREERLIDVPAAITALNHTAINRYAVSDANSLTQNVPNLMILSNGPDAGGSIGVRGISNFANDAGISPEVAFNIDGINLTRMRVNSLGLLDTDHVEVLEGPQALYFGKNSPAGVVSISSVDPGPTFGGYLRGSYEFTKVAPELVGALNIPINDQLSIRLAFQFQEQRGWLRNHAQAIIDPIGYAPLVDPGAVNKYIDGDDQELGRISVKYTPNEHFNALLKFVDSRLYTRGGEFDRKERCAPGVDQIVTSPGFGAPTVPSVDNTSCSTHFQASEGALNPTLASHYIGSNGGVPFGLTEMDLTSLALNYKVGQITLTSITGYFDMHRRNYVNEASQSTPYLTGADRENYHQISEELRASSNFTGPFNFMLGGYYDYNHDEYISRDYFNPKFGIIGPDTRYGYINTTFMQDETGNTTYSLFGSADWKILPNLDLTAGARWTHESKVSVLQNLYLNNTPKMALGINILLPEGTVITAPTADSNISPEVTLTWHPQPDFNIYVAYKTGYKSGGTSNAETLGANATAKSLSFLPETAKGEEVGAKGEWLDRRLSMTFDVYNYEFLNLQVQSLYFSQNLAPTFQILNAAAARTRGFELQGNFQATPDLSLRAHIDYNKAIYTKFDNAACTTDQTAGIHGVFTPGCNATLVTLPGGRTTTTHTQDLSGRVFPHAPEWFIGGGATWSHDITDALRITLDGDLNYESSFVRGYGFAAYATQPGFLLVNAAIRLSAPGKGWEVALIGSNLSNVAVFDTIGAIPGTRSGSYAFAPAPPREVTLQLSYQF